MKVALIFNPAAGAADLLGAFLARLDGGQRCELHAARDADEVRRFARQALEEGFDRILAAGGDGTVNHVVNGIAPDFGAVEVAVLPFGTGNDLARAVGLSADRMDDLCVSAFGTAIRRIDLLRLTWDGEASYCVNVANGGFGGRVAVDVDPRDKRRWGPMAYWLTSVTRLIDLEQFHIELIADEERIELKSYGLAVANGRFVGGGFPIAPHAALDDGVADITVFPVLPAMDLLAAGLNHALSREDGGARIRTLRARSVAVRATPDIPFSIDGEPSRRADLAFEVIPRALRLAIGEHCHDLPASPRSSH